MRHSILALGVVVGLGLLGCTKSKPTPAAGAAAAQGTANAAAQPAPQPIHVPASATPEQVMTVFLQAWRTGDSPTMDSLLTTKAREELTKHDVHVDPLSSPNAVYEVEPARSLTNDPNVVHVNSKWTEQMQNEQGQPIQESYGIVWALRRQANGWRVAGMQMELVPGQLQHVDFEDPAAMLQKMADASAALNPPQAATAATPTQPGIAPPAGAVQPPQSAPAAAIQTAQQPQFPPTQSAPQRIER